MNIYFEEGQVVTDQVLETMEKAASKCLELEGIEPDDVEISVTFVEAEEIRVLNRDYRDTDKVTDVLSFPQFDDLNDLPEVGEICLGDVVICKERAEEQAEEFGHSFEREIIYLFTHSILHLLGYDHMEEDEKAEMRAREEEVMEFLDLKREDAKTTGEANKDNSVSDKELFRKALEVAPNAYSPFSKFRVGAALLTNTGEVFTGVNIENSSYGGTICAERTAAVKAISEGFREFDSIAVVSPDGKSYPCGICRQFLYEFAPDLRVITGEDEDHLEIYTLKELLPEGFRL